MHHKTHEQIADDLTNELGAIVTKYEKLGLLKRVIADRLESAKNSEEETGEEDAIAKGIKSVSVLK